MSQAVEPTVPLRVPRPCSRSAAIEPLFESVFLGGFECSCHVLEDGRRLDLLASTRHLELVDADYARLRAVGITACRDGMPWAVVERGGAPSFTPFLPMVRAAERHGIRVVWDLMHFGWPDDVDPFSAAFPVRFGRYAAAFAKFLASETSSPPFVAPVNEMSFLAWAGGDVRCMNPFEAARGVELKAQLVRATIEAIEAIRAVFPAARFVQPEPIVHLAPDPDQPLTWRRVASDNLLVYQAWDMLTGRVWPSLGGHPRYLDIVGVNYYPANQFMLDGRTVGRDDPAYRPFSSLLLDVWRRYRRPMFVAETGAEGSDRAPWLEYVAAECVRAMEHGCELHGVTLYPILDHPGWLDDRHCENGLWGYADACGDRTADAALLAEIERTTPRLASARARVLSASSRGEHVSVEG